MKPLFILFLIFQSISGFCQTSYKSIYTDTLNTLDFNTQVDSMRKRLSDRGLPDEVIELFILKNFPNSRSFAQYQKRTVTVSGDSSVITLDYSSNTSSYNFVLTTIKYMVRKGKLYRFDPIHEKFVLSEIPESSQIFTYTGGTLEILGYKCKEYISADSVYKVYISEELPETLNPGIGVRNINGAVLRFEARRNKALTISTLASLEVVKEVI